MMRRSRGEDRYRTGLNGIGMGREMKLKVQ
jgi:hypothetical protein